MSRFVIILLLAVAAAVAEKSPSYYDPPAVRIAEEPTPRILEMVNEHHAQLGYNFRFASEDGISREESASYDAPVSGTYSYTSPEGAEVLVKYVADENGFRAEGLALPTVVPTEYPTPSVPSTEPAVPRSTYGGYGADAAVAVVRQTAEARTPPQQKSGHTSALGYSKPAVRAAEYRYQAETRAADTEYTVPQLRTTQPPRVYSMPAEVRAVPVKLRYRPRPSQPAEEEVVEVRSLEDEVRSVGGVEYAAPVVRVAELRDTPRYPNIRVAADSQSSDASSSGNPQFGRTFTSFRSSGYV